MNRLNPRPGVQQQVQGGDEGEALHELDGQQAAKVRHHQRAIPSVCGSAWNINAIGAPAINTTVSATRTT